MNESAFSSLSETLESGGSAAAIDRLIETFESSRQLPQLFEALLIKKRHELGLPLEGTESIRDIPDRDLASQDTVVYLSEPTEKGSLRLIPAPGRP